MLLRIGHRGARGHAPENTLVGLEKAIALHAHVVEFDVHRTRDGHLVLLHDATIDRTTNGRGAVATMSLNELRALTPEGGQPIPLLEDALRVTSGRAGVMIELKVEGTAQEACRVVHQANFSGPVLYASFLHDELLVLRKLDAHAHTVALLEGVPINRTGFASDAQVTHVGLSFQSMTLSFLAALRAKDLRVFVYTVNEPADIRAAKDLGVDGIVSDFPERLL